MKAPIEVRNAAECLRDLTTLLKKIEGTGSSWTDLDEAAQRAGTAFTALSTVIEEWNTHVADANEGFILADAEEAMTDPAAPLLRRALATYGERRGTYGASEQKFATLMQVLFPRGLGIDGQPDWVRMGLFVQIVSKLARYTADFDHPHVDSIHDLGVYAFMLEAEDRRRNGQAPFYMVPP